MMLLAKCQIFNPTPHDHGGLRGRRLLSLLMKIFHSTFKIILIAQGVGAVSGLVGDGKQFQHSPVHPDIGPWLLF